MTPDLNDRMTKSETEHFTKLEQLIEKGLQTFVDVGNALLEIRDSRLYRDRHDTFENYCHERWQMSKTHANRLIEAAEVCENLTPAGVIPESERVARPLAKLEPEQQREVWETAVKDSPNGKPTAKDVQAAADKLKSPNVRLKENEPSWKPSKESRAEIKRMQFETELQKAAGEGAERLVWDKVKDRFSTFWKEFLEPLDEEEKHAVVWPVIDYIQRIDDTED